MNYNLQDYNYDLNRLEVDLIAKLNENFADLELASDKFEDCEILEFTKVITLKDDPDFMVDISLKGGIKGFCFNASLRAKLFELPADKKELFDELYSALVQAKKDFTAELDKRFEKAQEEAKIEYENLQRKIEATKLRKEQEAAEKKFQARITKATEKFEHDIKVRIVVNDDIVDWLKANVVSINATIPSHLESSFIKVFGEQPHRTVDSRRKTSGGYSMKFGPSFSMIIKKDATTVPAELADKIKNNRIDNTSFIANLVRAYGLKFGKIS